ncbi:MAG TPA: hypothetical protein VGU44_04630 [Gammaproteobacteria bacterium]|nr:hypothetical protein [Gammaproteobacteria bacterium]
MITNTVMHQALKKLSEKDASQIQQLCTSLNTFNASKSLDTYPTTQSGCHLLANDLYLLSDISSINSRENHKRYLGLMRSLQHIKEKTCSLALVVGNGNIISLLNEINANIILLCDIDPRVHIFVNFCKELIIEQSQQIKAGFLKFDEVKDDIIDEINKAALELCPPTEDDGGGTETHFLYRIKEEIKCLEELHFLSSQKRFLQCAKALQEKHIFHACINLFNEQEIDHLINLTLASTYKITYMNLSNLADYDVRHIMRERLLNSKQLIISKENFNAIATSLNHPHTTTSFGCLQIMVYFLHVTNIGQLYSSLDVAYHSEAHEEFQGTNSFLLFAFKVCNNDFFNSGPKALTKKDNTGGSEDDDLDLSEEENPMSIRGRECEPVTKIVLDYLY